MMLSPLRRYLLETKDRLRFAPWLRGLLCRKELWAQRMPAADDHQALARSIQRLCAAARLATTAELQQCVEARIHERLKLLEPRRVDWGEFDPDTGNSSACNGAVLKPWLGPREKGVVFLSFEYSWLKLLRRADYRGFAERYSIVIAPSWSPPYHLANVVLPKALAAPVFSLISNRRDLQILPRLAANYVVVPLFASSWVNPDYFQPVPLEKKDIDLIMVANFGEFKRHFALFRALRTMPREIRVVLIGQEQDGRTSDTLRSEAQIYGVADRFELHCNMAYEKLTSYMARARASAILSRREGSCVVVVESMFANTPVGLLEDAEIGSKHFINEQTGRLLRPHRLAEDLTDLIRSAASYSPRQWALQHLSCTRSSAILNDMLKSHALSQGQDWTQDIAPLCWRPDPQVLRPDDRARLLPEREEIEKHFGLRLGSP